MAATIDSAALQKTQRGRGQGVRDGEAVEKHWVYLEPQASTSGSCGLERPGRGTKAELPRLLQAKPSKVRYSLFDRPMGGSP